MTGCELTVSERITLSSVSGLFTNNRAGTKCVEQLMNDDGSTGNVIVQEIFVLYFLTTETPNSTSRQAYILETI